jgi:hypothetical protein
LGETRLATSSQRPSAKRTSAEASTASTVTCWSSSTAIDQVPAQSSRLSTGASEAVASKNERLSTDDGQLRAASGAGGVQPGAATNRMDRTSDGAVL